jgi:hypothetical protein
MKCTVESRSRGRTGWLDDMEDVNEALTMLGKDQNRRAGAQRGKSWRFSPSSAL